MTAPPPGCPAHGSSGPALRRLFGAEAESDPMGLYERLRREHGTVAPVLVHGDVPAWLVLGYHENLEVMRSPSRFSRDSRRWHALQDGKVGPEHPLAPIVAWQPICVFTDGAEHERLRGAVTASLDRFNGRGVRRHITRFAHQLIDDFTTDGRAELVNQFAEQLPMLVMTQLLGMPEKYGPRLVEAARDMIQGTETAVASNAYIMQLLGELVAEKRVAPGPDFASWLIEHHSNLTDAEAEQHLRLVLIAAFETTANLIANTLRRLLTDRNLRSSLAARGGHLSLPDAVEQVLWNEPPFTTILGRWATGDTELGGQHIKGGDMVILGLAAGNVDPAIRTDPDDPDDGSANSSHLAFSGGPHECPGRAIGRAIADTGIDVLLTRLPDLHLSVPDSELRVNSSLMSRHLVELPVEFTPGPKQPEQSAPYLPVTPPAQRQPESASESGQPADAAGPGTEAADTAAGPRRRRWWRRLADWLRRPAG
ncbi:cytochrome P450 [Streptomyces sp. RB6PN25]|uniref:Cytochrome P450 n=1 Tax=Streptomyces humicola TaxID=2953240 RepID=A0ABT1PYZ6_9ACTN|nr:cytochrome P450 [Streptomyces humicola]MCQ4082891.1 cytochrome P450 [Streptomyces humicola]